MRWRTPIELALPTLVLAACVVAPAHGQNSRLIDGRYEPLDQRIPPGVTSTWMAATRSLTPGYVQPVRIETPAGTKASVFSGTNGAETLLGAPAQTALVVGHVYRFRLSNLPDAPAAELFPTVELVGHLHPPADLKNDFPVRIPFTIEEIQLALGGRLVTKVIYLEEPKLASAVALEDEVTVTEVSPRANALHEADRRGRPVAIVRIGGRTPTSETPSLDFLGSPPAVSASKPTRMPPARNLEEDAPGNAPVEGTSAPRTSLLDRFDETRPSTATAPRNPLR